MNVAKSAPSGAELALPRCRPESGRPPGATETLVADVTDKDQTIRAVAGSTVVHLVVGLKYDHKLWEEMWPRVMSNAIDACKRARAKLLFFDNVYMYGKVSGPMTEETPFNPCSKKGEIRAKIATTLINEWKRSECARLRTLRQEAKSVMARG